MNEWVVTWISRWRGRQMDEWRDASIGVNGQVGGWLNGSMGIHVKGRADTHGPDQDAISPEAPTPVAPAKHAPAAPTLARLGHALSPPALQVPRRPALRRVALSIGQNPRRSSSQPMTAAREGTGPAQNTGVIFRR